MVKELYQKMCINFLLVNLLICPGFSNSDPSDDKQDFSQLIALIETQQEHPYKQLEYLEKYYRKVSQNHLDYGLRIASVYLDKSWLTGDSSKIAHGYHLRGTSFLRAGQTLNALEDFYNSLRISEEIADSLVMSNTYNNLGILYDKLGKSEEALGYFNKSLLISTKLKDLEGKASVLNNLSSHYNEAGQKEKALKVLLEAQNIWLENNDTLNIAFNLGNIGNFYLHNEDFAKAEEYLLEAKFIFEKNNDFYNLAYTYHNLGLLKYHQQLFEEAIDMFESGLDLARRQEGHLHVVALLLKKMSETFAEKKDYHNAYRYELEHGHARDSILNQEALEQITFYQSLYETENKEREINLLKKEQVINELQLDQKIIALQKVRLRATVLLFFFIISTLSGVIIVSRGRNKRLKALNAGKLQAQREQLKTIIKTQEQERIRFARDLHDGLGQMLTSLRMNLTHASNTRQRNMENTLHTSNQMIKEMHQEIRNISFNIMPQLLLQKGLLPAVYELTQKINFSENLCISVAEHEVTHRFDPETEIAIYRIIQELLTNIIKYSKARKVNLQFTQHVKELNIHIEDDGWGFDTMMLEKSKGSGWKNICSRARLINARLEYDSKAGRKNSTIIIDIPIKQSHENHVLETKAINSLPFTYRNNILIL